MADDDYRSRMLEIVEDLHSQGVGRYSAAPPVYRLAWRLGFRVRPPIYQSFTASAFQSGAGFALFYGLMMWLLFWRSEEHSAVRILVTSIGAGLVFGLAMAAVHVHQRKGVRLPPL